MARNDTTWEAGRSGNPKGRPKKQRALTALLERGGSKKYLSQGAKPRSNREVFVEQLWRGLTTGVLRFEDDMGQVTLIPLDAREFIQLAKLVLDQVDGSPPAAVDVTSGGEPIAQIQLVEVVKTYEDV